MTFSVENKVISFSYATQNLKMATPFLAAKLMDIEHYRNIDSTGFSTPCHSVE